MAVFNVKNYGALGNGIHDDRTAIQAAVDAAYKAGGGTVYLPEGTYIVSGNEISAHGAIRLRDNVTMQGAGMGDTIVKLKDGWNQKVTGIIRTVSGEVNHDITLRDLTIDGNMAKNRGEVDGFFTGVTPGLAKADQNILVERVEIKNVSRYGFDPHEQTVGLTIRDSVAHHNGFDGFTIDYQSYGLLENNVSYANGRHGFNIVTSSHDMVLRNNEAYGNGDEGLTIQRGSDNRPLTDDITVEGGEYHHNGGDGVLIKMSTDVTVSGVEIHDNGRYGLEISGSRGSMVTTNVIYNNSQSSAGNFSEVYLNEYDDSDGASGLVFSSVYNQISDNLIFTKGHASDYGIREVDATTRKNIYTENVVGGTFRAEVSLFSTKGPSNILGDGAADYINHYLTTHQWNGIDAAGGITGDTIMGTSGGDSLVGSDGDDTINGSGGNDALKGGNGNDYLLGGDGKDNLSGGEGGDNLSAHTGDDRLYGNNGNDVLRGGEGNDFLAGAGGDDRLYGGTGIDIFVFIRGGGRDQVRDFSHSDDRLNISDFGYSSMSSLLLTQSGTSVVVTLSNTASIVIADALVTDITSHDFIWQDITA